MKKMLITTLFVALTAISFSSHNSAGVVEVQTPVKAVVDSAEQKAAEMKNYKDKLSKYITEADKTQLEKNKVELKEQLSAKEPDWKKIESLNDKNALIMSKAKTKMQQEEFKMKAAAPAVKTQ